MRFNLIFLVICQISLENVANIYTQFDGIMTYIVNCMT